jgi:hypothetical protein
MSGLAEFGQNPVLTQAEPADASSPYGAGRQLERQSSLTAMPSFSTVLSAVAPGNFRNSA